jgi:hypothetical protein
MNMKRIIGALVLMMMGLALSASAQQRLSSSDQREFDKYYSKWVNDTRKNDRDDIGKDVKHMQEIMGRNGIPANTPYNQIASTGNEYPTRAYQNRLTGHDQAEFDKNYTKWVADTRKNDRDDIAKDERHMQEIMARNNIPLNVPYDQVASTGYPVNGYPAAAAPSNGPWQGRLSPDDQRSFDRYYAKWVDDTRRNDRDEIGRDAGYMQEIMARNGIPSNVPFDQIAGTVAYPNSAYPSGAYSQSRLSPDDQREFDKYYSKWVDDTRRGDRDDTDRDLRHMQDIMVRYNIPSNVPFDQIATPNALQR